MAFSGETPEPYRIRFSEAAGDQVAALPVSLRERLGHQLSQLADLAAFLGHSLVLTQMRSGVASAQGLSTKYEIDDTNRTINVLEVTVSDGDADVAAPAGGRMR